MSTDLVREISELSEMVTFLQGRFNMTLENALISVAKNCPHVMEAFLKEHSRQAND
jgi:hypothetical protein